MAIVGEALETRKITEELALFVGPDNVRFFPERTNPAGKLVPACYSMTGYTEDLVPYFVNAYGNTRFTYADFEEALQENGGNVTLRITLEVGTIIRVTQGKLSNNDELVENRNVALQNGMYRLAVKHNAVSTREEF